MRFKCVTCGVKFDNIEQLASHRKQHQASSKGTPGVTCLGCGNRGWRGLRGSPWLTEIVVPPREFESLFSA